MPRLIAFLRAINVGGHTVTMARLRELFEELEFREVETFIASGNVLFTTGGARTRGLEETIGRHLERSLGYEVAVFLRTGAEVAAVAGYQPFPEAAVRKARVLNVGFLPRPLSSAEAGTLMGLRTEIDDFHARGRELYWLCRKGQGESTFSNVRFERTVGVRTTFRQLSTIARLAARYSLLP
jgi:uncharacterized protein (DUF1697 family)